MEDQESLKEKLQLEEQYYRHHHSHANHLKQKIRLSSASVAKLSEYQVKLSKSQASRADEMPFNAAIDDQNEYQLRIVPQVHTAREKLNEDVNYVSEFEIPHLDELASNKTGRVERINS